jgi:TolB-like protein
MHSFLEELKRRNVYKVAVAYTAVAWLIIQVATQTFPFFEIPNGAVRVIIIALAIGFPVALVIGWVFELTPRGLVRTESLAPAEASRAARSRSWIVVAAAAALLSIALFLVGRYSATRSDKVAPGKSIAVLPFDNLSSDPQNAFFAEGVQDEILTSLARVADLKVISRTSVMQYRGDEKRNLRDIGQELGVAHLLEGSVQRAGQEVRVNAKLFDARTDAQLWAQSYDRDLADVFTIQSEIAKSIADQLHARLSPREKSALEERPTDNLAAFEAYRRAKDLLLASTASGVKQSLLSAVVFLNQALTLDPSFFAAQVELVTAHTRLYSGNFDRTPARLALAEAALEAASRLRPDAGETHLARATLRYRGHADYTGALRELELARRTLPNNPQIPYLAGAIMRRQGKHEEALRQFERSVELDPLNFFTLQQIGRSYDLLRYYAKEVASLDRALSVKPDDIPTKVARAFLFLDWKARPSQCALFSQKSARRI